MNEHPELSRLPDDEAYWQELEARIVASLGRPAAVAAADPDPWAPLTSRALELAALAVAAALATVFLAPAPRSAPAATSSLGAVAGFLGPPPDDVTVVASLTAEAPPALGQLVLPVTVNEEEEESR